MIDNKKEQERDELHRTIWNMANDLRGSVDGWDFKQYVLGMLFYRYISENFVKFVNAGELEAGNKDFDYAKLEDEVAEEAREDLLQSKGYFILPSQLFCNVKEKAPNNENLKICTFLWVYYGYPSSSYEGVNVEKMRYECGARMAKRDNARPDIVAGVPDSGTAHAVGYANESGIPFSRPFVKYTPTWPRSFMPTMQSRRDLIARMKLLAVDELIKDKSLLLIDDSIVRGTQLRETTEFLYQSGAKEVHIRPACPPLLYGCKYLNFSRSSSEMDLITRRVIERLEGGNVTDEVLRGYADPETEKYEMMVEEIRKELNFTSLRFNRLDDLLDAAGIDKCRLCTYCWDGKE